MPSQKRLIYEPTNSFYQVLSAEAYSKHGFNVHGVVFDELHSQPNRKLYDVLTKGSGDARMQPLFFLITTAGTDTHSICYLGSSKGTGYYWMGEKFTRYSHPVIFGADDTEDGQVRRSGKNAIHLWVKLSEWIKLKPLANQQSKIRVKRTRFDS